MQRHSTCVQSGKKVSECLKEKEGLPSECVAFKRAYFECRRGLLDNRNRIRGRKGQRAHG
jgi:cytochrome c oxidase assembly factor 5